MVAKSPIVKVFTGKTIEEAKARARMALGDKIVFIAEREVLKGGFLGFFKEKLYEVEAVLYDENFSMRPPKRTFSSQSSSASNFHEHEDILHKKGKILSTIQQLKKTKNETSSEETPFVKPNQKALNTYLTLDKKFKLEKSSENDSGVSEELKMLKEMILKLDKKIEKIAEVKVIERETGLNSSVNASAVKDTLPKNLEEIYELLCEQGFDKKLIKNIMIKLKDFPHINDRLKLLEYFWKQLEGNCVCECRKEKKIPGQPETIVVVGPTGVGKTTTLIKFAVQCALKDKSVVIITIDNYRLGAAAQIQAVSEVVEVPCLNPSSEEEFKYFLDKYATKDFILIDTAGRSPSDIEEIEEIERYLRKIPYQKKVYLTLTAHMTEKSQEKAMRNFSRLQYEHIIYTKLDETEVYGPVFNTMFKKKKSVAYFTNGQNVASHIFKAGNGKFIEWFFQKVFPEEYKILSEKKKNREGVDII